jgi:membrane protease YdiL (CAAX protease family)
MLPDPTDSLSPTGEVPSAPPVPSLPPEPSTAARILAAFEVLICSDFPTQIVVSQMLVAFGLRPSPGGALSIEFIVLLSLIDSIALIGLMVLFLRAHGERPRDVFLGRAPVRREIKQGLPLIFIAIAIALVVLLSIQAVAPWLHSVAENPLGTLIRSPRDAWLFALVVIVAGGVREELQRAFLLHRFEGFLGGPIVGVIVTSVAFGAGHVVQGYDAMIATGLLGAFWGVIYLKRRSVVAPMVSHAGFDLLQILQFLQGAA